jgi:dTDP-4-amino-4,6-dideoxygalactose transaminase
MEVPFLRLNQHPISSFSEKINAVYASGVFMNGSYTTQFTSAFSQYIGVKCCVPVANCTDALEIVLRAHGIGKGDQVIVPAFTWFSDASCAELVGATPVFADIHQDDFCMTADGLEALVTKRSKALVYTHLFGAVGHDFEKVKTLCKKYNLLLIEDCAQAHGAKMGERKAGSLGDVAVFSFYPTKNLGAFGDAGCICTNDEKIAARYKEMANHGQSSRNVHDCLGRNSRMDEIQAAFLEVKLPELDQQNAQRRAIARKYIDELEKLPVGLPQYDERNVFHQFVIRLKERDRLKQFLAQEGVETDIHYPVSLHKMDVFSTSPSFGKALPNAESAATEVLSLPIHPAHTGQEIDYVIEKIKAYFL